MVEFKVYEYKQVEGAPALDVTVWYNTKSSDSSAKPVVFYLHGGNFIVGHMGLLSSDYVQALFDLGFGAVVSPNYRLSPTISAYNGAVTDSRDAYEWTQTKLPELLAADVKVTIDPERLVTFGHSAGGTLALLMANSAKPPRAILDIFGMKYISTDPFFQTPNPAMSKIPDFEQSFLNQVLQQVPPPNGSPPPMGPKGPDFSSPRAAFLFNAMKNGIYLKAVAPDGQYDKIDPAKLFSSKFPPTYFIHGAADTGVPSYLSERAHKELEGKGVETKLVLVDGAPHGFDAGAKSGSEKFAIVEEGLKFLAAHV